MSLQNSDSAINPVVISSVTVGDQQKLALNYAAGADSYLTSDVVEVNNFYLRNLSTGKSKNIQFVLKLSTYIPDGSRLPDYIVTVTSTVELIAK